VKPQHEFIADSVWHEVAYGKNAVSHHGHHGNAVLSRYPIIAHENLDISAHAFESRGLLHCTIRLGKASPTCIASMCTSGFSSAAEMADSRVCERIRADRARQCAAHHRRRLQRLAAESEPADRR
jgi:hypothetical protein